MRPLLLAAGLLALAMPAAAGQAAPAAAAADLAEASSKANEAMRAGRYREAIPLYERLLEARPGDAGLMMNLGVARTLGGQPAAALDVLKRAVALDPSLTPAWLFLGNAYADLGRPEEAVAPLRKGLADDPKNVGARRLLAESLLTAGRPAEAAEEYRRLTGLTPDSPRAWFGLANASSAATAAAADQLQKTAPDSPYVTLLEAELAMAQEQPGTAATLVERALARAPDLKGAHSILADAYDALGRPGPAAEARERANAMAEACTEPTPECAVLRGEPARAASLAAGRDDVRSLYWRLQAHNALAAEAWTRLDTLPASAELHYVRALALESEGQVAEAADQLREAHKLEPDNPEIARRLGVLLLRTRAVDEAIALLTPLAKPGRPAELHYLLGEALLLAQRPEEAVAPLESAVRAAPRLAPARSALGRAYMQAGKPAEAIPHLEAVVETDTDGSLYYQLAQAYQRVGRAEDAKKALAEYQKRR